MTRNGLFLSERVVFWWMRGRLLSAATRSRHLYILLPHKLPSFQRTPMLLLYSCSHRWGPAYIINEHPDFDLYQDWGNSWTAAASFITSSLSLCFICSSVTYGHKKPFLWARKLILMRFSIFFILFASPFQLRIPFFDTVWQRNYFFVLKASVVSRPVEQKTKKMLILRHLGRFTELFLPWKYVDSWTASLL